MDVLQKQTGKQHALGLHFGRGSEAAISDPAVECVQLLRDIRSLG